MRLAPSSSCTSSLWFALLSLWAIRTGHGFVVVPIQATTTLPITTTSSPITSPTMLHALDLTEAIDSFYLSQPYAAAFLTCSVKASSADFFAQQQQSSKKEQSSKQSVDLSRNLAFLAYGGLYQGLCQQFIYTVLFPDLFGSLDGWQGVAAQVVFDNALVAPLLCLPVAYLVKSLFCSANHTNNNHHHPETNDKSTQQLSLGASIQTLQETLVEGVVDGLQKYQSDVSQQQLLFKYWSLWIPVNSLTFSIIPSHYRVAFVACVSFFWVFILSSLSNNSQEVDTTVQPATTS